MSDTTQSLVTPTPVELRTENGQLQAKLCGSRLEILRHGIVTIYDVHTGRRVATRILPVSGPPAQRNGGPNA